MQIVPKSRFRMQILLFGNRFGPNFNDSKSCFNTMSQRIQLAKGIVCREEVLLQKQTLRLIGAKEQIKPFFHNTSKNDY
jgi:hypothetical protein